MTTIEWTHPPGYRGETWNPVVGCSRVSEGCRNCYAERVVHRAMQAAHKGLTVVGRSGPHWTGVVRTLPKRVETPLMWCKPRFVFVNSLSDLFHEDIPLSFTAEVFEVMLATPRHRYVVLTKRPKQALEFFRWFRGGKSKAMANLILGVSVENQATADERIPLLLQCPAACRAVSYEPALGPVDDILCTGTDWVIVGGESGPHARSFDIDWARTTVRGCTAAAVPCFVKQLGSVPIEVGSRPVAREIYLRDRKGGDPLEWPEDLRVREWPLTLRAAAGELSISNDPIWVRHAT